MNAVQVPVASGSDRTTFVGAIVPPLIKGLPKQLKGLDAAVFAQVLSGECLQSLFNSSFSPLTKRKTGSPQPLRRR